MDIEIKLTHTPLPGTHPTVREGRVAKSVMSRKRSGQGFVRHDSLPAYVRRGDRSSPRRFTYYRQNWYCALTVKPSPRPMVPLPSAVVLPAFA